MQSSAKVGADASRRRTYRGEWVGWPAGIAPGPRRRVLDAMFSAVTLLILSPILAVVSIVVRCTGRPVLFRQDRVGQGGIPFTILKFRTMRPGPPGSLLTASGDSRVTRLGHILRAANVDELPQLFNILRGDMTLVGYRPETISLALAYPPECRQVFEYRPGLTGPSQLQLHDRDVLDASTTDLELHYLRDVVPQRTRLDLEYLRDPTMRRTLALLVQTCLPARFRPAPRRWVTSPPEAA